MNQLIEFIREIFTAAWPRITEVSPMLRDQFVLQHVGLAAAHGALGFATLSVFAWGRRRFLKDPFEANPLPLMAMIGCAVLAPSFLFCSARNTITALTPELSMLQEVIR